MLTLCRMVPLDQPGFTFPKQPAGWTIGWVLVEYKGNITWARPVYPLGSFRPPSDKWLTKYAPKLMAWVAPEEEEDLAQTGDHLCVLGFNFAEGTLPDDVTGAFPNKQFLYAADWEVVLDESTGKTELEVRAIDPDAPPGTPAEKVIQITLSKTDKKLSIAVDVVPVGKKPTVTFEHVDKDTVMTLGDGKVKAAIADHLKTLWGNLVTAINGLKAPSGTAGGPLVPSAGPPPAWDSTIESAHLLFPDNP